MKMAVLAIPRIPRNGGFGDDALSKSKRTLSAGTGSKT